MNLTQTITENNVVYKSSKWVLIIDADIIVDAKKRGFDLLSKDFITYWFKINQE